MLLPGATGYYKLRATSAVLARVASQTKIFLLPFGLRQTTHSSTTTGISHPGNHSQPVHLMQFSQLPTQDVLTFVGKEKEERFVEISPTFFEPINALKGRFYSGS